MNLLNDFDEFFECKLLYCLLNVICIFFVVILNELEDFLGVQEQRLVIFFLGDLFCLLFLEDLYVLSCLKLEVYKYNVVI